MTPWFLGCFGDFFHFFVLFTTYLCFWQNFIGSQVAVPKWQSDALSVLSTPCTQWTDMEWLLVCNSLQIAQDSGPDPTPDLGDVPSSSTTKAPKDWRKQKMAANAGAFPTDFFQETGDPKPYNMNGWRSKMVPLVGAHLRGDTELANKLAFHYSQNKSLEDLVAEHNQVMVGRSFDPKYGVRSTGFDAAIPKKEK